MVERVYTSQGLDHETICSLLRMPDDFDPSPMARTETAKGNTGAVGKMIANMRRRTSVVAGAGGDGTPVQSPTPGGASDG